MKTRRVREGSAATLRGVASAAGSILLHLGLALLLTATAVAQPDQPPSGQGAAVCLKCHESPAIMEIVDTPHADFEDPNSPASREQCESCHGPSGTHVNFPLQVGNIRFTKHGKTSIEERNESCLACHSQGRAAHWNESAHSKALQCGNCHKIHKRSEPAEVARIEQNSRCNQCHTTTLSEAPVGSKHPLEGEGAIDCTRCHNPHAQTTLLPCVDCHLQDAPTLARQTPKAQGYHARALQEEIECTACHKGFVHSMPQITHAAPAGFR